MKKLLLITASAVLAMNVALWGASINVTQPNAVSEWCIGSSHTITWGSSGVTGDVDIILRLAGNPTAPPVLGIAAATANDGTENWTIPATVAPGNYLVRIRSKIDASVFDDSPDFEIKDCAVPSITVTNPHGQTWYRGNDYTIQWNSSNVAPGNVHIILRQAGAPDAPPVMAIASNTANDGTEAWTIPNSVATGDYLIRIRTVSESPYVFDDSSDFKIGKVIDPGILDKIREMRYYYIRIPRWPPEPDPWWKIDFGEFREIMHNKFEGSIFLFKNGQKVKEIGRFGKNNPVADSLKFKMGELNSKNLKNGTAKFSLGIFDAQGNLLQETPLEVQVEQQLR